MRIPIANNTTRLGVGLAAVLITALLTGCQQPKLAAPVAYESEPWSFRNHDGHKITTEHYEIYTTIEDEVLVNALPDFVETAYDHYNVLLPPGQPYDKRMQVLLFATRGDWEAFTRKFTGSRAREFLLVRNGGYSERGVSVIQYVSHSVTFPLFSHEGFHQYAHFHIKDRIPAWLNEGLAVCCEGQRWISDEGRYGVHEFDPWYNPVRRNSLGEALARDELHPLSTLLSTHPGKVIAGSSRMVHTYYAQVWALVLFLREGMEGKYADDFQRMQDALAAGEVEQHARAANIWAEGGNLSFGEAVFRSFITEDLNTVEREYIAFMRARILGEKLPEPSPAQQK